MYIGETAQGCIWPARNSSDYQYTSLICGNFAKYWKRAIVRPLSKKPGLDLKYKNYRPVSNLSFLSKIVEKASAVAFQQHLDSCNLLPDYPSAYHSTETLLLKVYNDILQ